MMLLGCWLLLLAPSARSQGTSPPLTGLSGQIMLFDETEVVPYQKDGEEKKVRHKKKKEEKQHVQKGGYKTKEKVEKAPSEDHPCNLTRTSVKISFPALKDELFVNFLGYKEPNLVYLWRCKGVCGETRSPIACSPTRVSERKVNMMFKVKTHLKGRLPVDRTRELILDEHEECGCRCQHISASQCRGGFDEAACECRCEERTFGQERRRCEADTAAYWDSLSCSCMSKSVAPRGIDYQPGGGCPGGREGRGGSRPPTERHLDGFDMISCVLLGSCATLSAFLAATTVYYRRKARALQIDTKPNVMEYDRRERERSKEKRVERERKEASWRYPQQPGREGERQTGRGRERERRSRQPEQPAPVHGYMDLGLVLDTGDGQLYHEQYNEHGVLIERGDCLG